MSVFLDSELTEAERKAEDALFTIIPMPLERTVSYGSGTVKGPEASSKQVTNLSAAAMALSHALPASPHKSQ
ncbi:hypothetical protein [Pseudovibrio denitrificans]|uniref:hypothetical protein n=1 Tax=Pseudovibrio denitrificans TaxID=258256 RepID=UPI000AA42471|nr:hypothetical protein [Pseudovibrio denitrificans]